MEEAKYFGPPSKVLETQYNATRPPDQQFSKQQPVLVLETQVTPPPGAQQPEYFTKSPKVLEVVQDPNQPLVTLSLRPQIATPQPPPPQPLLQPLPQPLGSPLLPEYGVAPAPPPPVPAPAPTPAPTPALDSTPTIPTEPTLPPVAPPTPAPSAKAREAEEAERQLQLRFAAAKAKPYDAHDDL